MSSRNNVFFFSSTAMRRRFEKRVYIALPDATARATIFKVNLGDTPHDITGTYLAIIVILYL